MAIQLGDITNNVSGMSTSSSTKGTDFINENLVFDNSWFDIRFIPPESNMDAIDIYNRFYTTASRKFTSTRLGGNFGINVKPQFTRWADIRHGNRGFRGRLTINNLNVDAGLGRVYSERYDDAQQLLMLQFGKEKFNSLSNFILSAIDYRDSYIANTGRYPTGYTVGSVVGAGIMLAAFPWITLTIWGLKFASGLVMNVDNFNYYYMEPTMHLYWSAVSQIVTILGTELGILIPELMPEKTEALKIGIPVKLNTADLDAYKALMPGLFTENNYIDIFKIATTTQTLANRLLLEEYELYQKGENSPYDFLGYVYKDGVIKEHAASGSGLINTINYNLSFSKWLEKLTKGKGLFASEDKKETQTPPDNTGNASGNTTGYTRDANGLYDANKEDQTYMEKLAETIDAGIKEGGGYAIFNVDFVGTSSESFSNSTSEVNLGSSLNSVATAARNMKFNFAGGNIIGETTQDVVGAAKNVAAGTLDSVTHGVSNVIQTLTGNAYTDIPKKWDISDMSFPTLTYNMSLRALYNTPFSRLKDELIPLAMILAGVLPLSAGPSSHTSPFLCEAFTKGIQHIKMGMITSVTVTRGVNNLAYDKNKNLRGIDVSFNITDFSTIMTAPINTSIFDTFNIALEDSKPLNRYLAVLASRDLLTSKYMVPRMKLKASRLLMNIDKAFSPHAIGMRIGHGLNNLLGGMVADHAMSLSQSNKL